VSATYDEWGGFHWINPLTKDIFIIQSRRHYDAGDALLFISVIILSSGTETV